MKRNNIMILVADKGCGFSCSCADRYVKTAEEAGAEVRRFNLSEMDFDPVAIGNPMFNPDYTQELEPVLLSFRETVTWADHLVFVYANWWNTMPAKLKGLFDRALTPGFAFSMEDGDPPLLTGKSGRIINISGHEEPVQLLERMGPFTNEIEHGVLRFCGVDPVSVTCFGPTRIGRDLSEEQKRIHTQWLQEVEEIAKKDIV